MKPLSLCARVRTTLKAVLSPRVFLPLAALVFVLVSAQALHRNAHTDHGRADLVSGDSKHYLEIAEDFAAENFSMDYVQRRPHRQPLYPATLAAAMHFAGESYFWMGVVNILFATAGFLVLYGAVLHLLGSPAIAAISGILYLHDDFLFAEVTQHFLTEPLHILLMVGVIFLILRWLRDGRPWLLPATAGLIGLDYLTRPNGLFVAAAFAATLGLRELCLALSARNFAPRVKRLFLPIAASLAVFAVVTTPSWAPRLRDYGQPFYHGYLSNYLWVDSYAEGHQGQRTPKYTWRDYAASHSVADALRRTAHGIWNVGFAIPWSANPKIPALFLLALLGAALALIRGPSEYRWLLLFGIIQLLPLIWTNLSNPTMRVPYAATMPFEVFYAAIGAEFAFALLRRTSLSRLCLPSSPLRDPWKPAIAPPRRPPQNVTRSLGHGAHLIPTFLHASPRRRR